MAPELSLTLIARPIHAENSAVEAATRVARLTQLKNGASGSLMRPLQSISNRVKRARRKVSKRFARTTQSKCSIIGDVKALVAFISGEPHIPGHYYRVENIRKALAPRFFETVVIGSDELPARLPEIRNADVVWIWRAAFTEQIRLVIETARKDGARIVYDVDDLMFRPELARVDIIDGIRSQGFEEKAVQELFASIQAVIFQSDHCTAPTHYLAHQLRQIHKPATVIPNGFDCGALIKAREARSARDRRPDDQLIRIGYAAGTRTHQRDFAVACAAVTQILAAHPNTRLVIFENTLDIYEFPELEPFRNQIEWRSIVPITKLLSEYSRFDINVAPLEVGNAFCEAKSELKYFEAALVGVPTIASPTGPFAHIIKNGETGFLAGCESEWREHLQRLIDNPDLRRQIAENAYADILWTFGPERRNMLVTRLLNMLLAPPPIAAELARSGLTETASPLRTKAVIPEFDVIYKSVRGSTSRVSVIISLYNYGVFVVQALESVKNQSLREVDLIVVDDCSTDDSTEIARAWLENSSYRFNMAALLRNRHNSKLPRTRNAGILFAQTEFVLPLDADNLLLPSCLERCVALLDETAAAVAYPTIELFGDDGGLIGMSEWDPARLQFGNYIDAMAMLRKACWAAVGGYSPLDLGWEDYDLWCKFVEAGFWGVRVPEVTARYRVHSTSMLRTCTDVPETKARLIADITARHPWLDPKDAART